MGDESVGRCQGGVQESLGTRRDCKGTTTPDMVEGVFLTLR